MRKRFIGTVAGLILMLVSSAALSQLSPPFQPQPSQQPGGTTQTPKVAGWFRYQMSELLPINNAMAVTHIEYPKDWQVMPDY